MFSIFVVAGTSEEADQAAMPPRLVAICRNPANGEEIIRRNQVGCAEFLAGIEWPAPVEDPRIRPELPPMEVLDVIGRHMSHLTHWDARPERLVATLERLAAFVSRDDEDGERIFFRIFAWCPWRSLLVDGPIILQSPVVSAKLRNLAWNLPVKRFWSVRSGRWMKSAMR